MLECYCCAGFAGCSRNGFTYGGRIHVAHFLADQLKLTTLSTEITHTAVFDDFVVDSFRESNFLERFVAHAGHDAAKLLELVLHTLQVRFGWAAELFFFVVFNLVGAHKDLVFKRTHNDNDMERCELR